MENPKSDADLIRPAVDGTLRALKAARAAGVTRVVLTSSVVSVIYSDKPKGHVFGPDDWTDTNHPTAQAYPKSKTLAERAAWDFVAEHPEMQLTTINPGLVLGAPLDAKYGTSLQLVERLLGGKDPAVPDLDFSVVDVADVSRLHVEALTRPATIGKRVIAVAGNLTMPEMGRLLAKEYPGRKIATRQAPTWLISLLALFDPAVRAIKPLLGLKTPLDASETHALLGGEMVPPQEALLASAQAILAK